MTLLAIFAFPVLLVAGGVAVNALLAREYGMAGKAGTVFAICVTVYIAAHPPAGPKASGKCYIDWDGRSNPVVCD